MTKSIWQAYYELCKPRVVALMLLTAIVGMHLATPHPVPLSLLLAATIGIACCASSAACINHVIDRQLDSLMRRTELRPIPTGVVTVPQALLFAGSLCVLGMVILLYWVNNLTAWLTFATFIGYAVCYTVFLKHATSQNIVIGGLAGAAPPLLGWVAVTGQLDANSLLPMLIIFIWTPPHFWSLAIYRYQDYARAAVPMLPVTHGIQYTKLQILLYTLLLLAVSLLPFVTGMNSWIYLTTALLLGGRFIHWAYRLYRTDDNRLAFKTFRYSITYLLLLFIVMLIDHYCK